MQQPKRKRVIDLEVVRQARKNFCQLCGNTSGPLHVHHIKSRGAGGDDVPENLVTLCFSCHAEVHNGNLRLDKVIDNPNMPSLEVLIQSWVNSKEQEAEAKWTQGSIVVIMLDLMRMSVNEVASTLGCSSSQVRELAKTFKAFPTPESRAKDLSWYHHRVAAQSKHDAQMWIDLAAQNGWSYRQLEEAMREARAESEDSRKEKALRRAERAFRLVKEVLDAGGGVAEWLAAKLISLMPCYQDRVPHESFPQDRTA